MAEPWGIAHWHGSYTPVDRETRLELDGILLVSLDDEGRCRDFREWSDRREHPISSRCIALADDELLRLARGRATDYAEAEPYPHAVFDGLFDPRELERAAQEFPALDDPCWTTYPSPAEEGKQEASDPAHWGPSVRGLIGELSSPAWLRFIEELTGFDDLVADTHGGGMHQSGPGARLGVHVDFNVHPRLGLERLVNLIVFLNPGWTEENGGLLELWSETERVKTVLPLLNRCVIFSASERSFHGHPVPVADATRRSIALYYYGRTGEELPERHSTIWR